MSIKVIAAISGAVAAGVSALVIAKKKEDKLVEANITDITSEEKPDGITTASVVLSAMDVMSIAASIAGIVRNRKNVNAQNIKAGLKSAGTSVEFITGIISLMATVLSGVACVVMRAPVCV